MTKVKIDNDNWIRCGKCGHKLGRVNGEGICLLAPIIEIKCHSCKEINSWWAEERQDPSKKPSDGSVKTG